MPLMKPNLVIVMFCLITGCSRSTGMQTAAEMKASLTKDIPVGTPVDVAETKLKARGFTVSREINGASATSQPSNYLFGRLEESGIVFRTWMVTVSHQQGLVTAIEVKTALTGP